MQSLGNIVVNLDVLLYISTICQIITIIGRLLDI